MFQRFLALLAICVTAFPLLAADNDGPVFVTPQEAGPDYLVQGEYLGDAEAQNGRGPWGAQVVALGEGKFAVVGYEGGLPGDGWQRGDRQETAEGKTEGGMTRFHADRWDAEIKDGVLTVRTASGDPVGTLKKVERKSPTLGAKPPQGAIVLFDGSSVDNFSDAVLTPEKWLTHECSSKQSFGDHSLHIEFRTPFKPLARGQARGNSGVYVQSRYEVQVLDSFGLEGADNECGGIYSITKPKVNMCAPPLIWQTYDIEYTAARYENDKKVKNARITVVHNGVKIIDDFELPKGTPGRLEEGPAPAPLFLQGHGNPVVYRNIWVVKK
ncbi:MAG: 3-keto-disaccharide hydrolase [Pirellulaceae bacterium]